MSKYFIQRQMALDYHSQEPPGKIEVVPTKPTKTQNDLSLAYSPGVAEPCLEIAKNIEQAYKYTSKGNLVAVISNGTAVLGLGNIGADAAKPVMEGKGVLFKIFAGIDVFDIEVNEQDPNKFVEIVKSLEPTFGAINLEDIKAPECFLIEKRLKEEMNIPVMHDDQHGTAIISGAALLNALELQQKKIEKVKFVVSGAGAAGISCCKLYIQLGAQRENFMIFDSKGILHKGRNLDEEKSFFAVDAEKANLSLADAMKIADVFIGLSRGNILSKEMIKSMPACPIVFAMANPDPEISYPDAIEVREDIIMATGRSDYPNQVNNVLGFPYIFRGALDVRATTINSEMLLAVVYALAELVKKPVPEVVSNAYSDNSLSFGVNYIVPKPTDPRLLFLTAKAVAQAAIKSGVAQKIIEDWEAYEESLDIKIGYHNHVARMLGLKAKTSKRKVKLLFEDAENIVILKIAQQILDEGIAEPFLLGTKAVIEKLCIENQLDIIDRVQIIDSDLPNMLTQRHDFAQILYEERCRKGVTSASAKKLMHDKTYFGCMMVKTGWVDAMITGYRQDYKQTIQTALRTIGSQNETKTLAGMYILFTKKGPLFFADATIHLNPTAQELAEITLLVCKNIRSLGITPHVAMLGYSNFGDSANKEEFYKINLARKLIKEKDPELVIDGEIQPHIALNQDLLKENYPFSELVGRQVNTLIFPSMSACNIAVNLLTETSSLESLGPVILGLKQPIHILQPGSHESNIYNMALMAVNDVLNKK
ncbi:MAG: NADP-dependent malic enzyme [Chitinophagaceae bacterium]